ncbi:hypothetical protein BG53_00370 [Paenibacillus darwinianus]|uniref:SH3b domain-containing protein n=2 Tax=Paenibacillus darwinianus TaxID=1380763 RepID=A0A9W5W7B7_9BACL|nr:hypothetical protein BG52_02005 [Paenibacillus darwinianus]EXX89293.1 hypothetical protein BG53_00370 [Paenibacillus darwinianus]EXX90010.1 hypothetical protein CH50_00455 [Paenibacillus darwinianus]
MYSKKNRSLQFVCVLSAIFILILTTGMLVATTENEPSAANAYAASLLTAVEGRKPEKSQQKPVPPPVSAAAALRKPTEPVGTLALSSVSAAASADSVAKSLDTPARPLPPSPAAKRYKVTAYHLNVRANADLSSDIIRVAEKGAVLDVVSATGNGWFKLAGEGYVSGKYVQPASLTGKVSGQVAVLSATMPPGARTEVKPEPAIAIHKLGNVQKPSSAVNSRSGLTESHIADLLTNTALAEQGLEQAILEIENEYGINAYFTIAVMKLESGNGKSRLARNKNNLFGLMARSGALSFETKGDSIRKFGQLIAKNYVGQGYATIEKVAGKYCPVNPGWPGLVKGIMKSDYRKL